MRFTPHLPMVVLTAVWLAVPAFARDVQQWQVAPYRRAVQVADIGGKGLREISGLAVSHQSDDLLWAINDGGGGTFLHALGRDGRDRGRVRVVGVRNRDWEDLASFRLGGSAYLLIADVGDNRSRHRSSILYVVKEPALHDEKFAEKARASLSWVIRFRYDEGPLDCEAVAVDASAKRILLLSKRRFPSLLFELPLVYRGDDPVAVARRLTEVPYLPRPSSFLRRMVAAGKRSLRDLAFSATAMDVAGDGSAAAVLTYGDAFLFPRSADETWAEAFARPPQRIVLPRLRQAEALAFAPDGQTLYVTSEGRSVPLLRLDPKASRIQSSNAAATEARGDDEQD
jgi:hypothetical protein